MDAKSAVCRLRLFLQCLDYIYCMCNQHTPQASERVKPLGTAVPLRDDPTEKPASQALIPRTASLRNTHKHLFPKESERNINNPHFPSGPPSHFPWQVISLSREPAFFLTRQHKINPTLRFHHRTEGYLRNPRNPPRASFCFYDLSSIVTQ